MNPRLPDIAPQDRSTVPARDSYVEAEHWLLTETVKKNPFLARSVLASLRLNKPCNPLAIAWLERVGGAHTLQASWARLVHRRLLRRGLAA